MPPFGASKAMTQRHDKTLNNRGDALKCYYFIGNFKQVEANVSVCFFSIRFRLSIRLGRGFKYWVLLLDRWRTIDLGRCKFGLRNHRSMAALTKYEKRNWFAFRLVTRMRNILTNIYFFRERKYFSNKDVFLRFFPHMNDQFYFSFSIWLKHRVLKYVRNLLIQLLNMNSKKLTFSFFILYKANSPKNMTEPFGWMFTMMLMIMNGYQEKIPFLLS